MAAENLKTTLETAYSAALGPVALLLFMRKSTVNLRLPFFSEPSQNLLRFDRELGDPYPRGVVYPGKRVLLIRPGLNSTPPASRQLEDWNPTQQRGLAPELVPVIA